MQNLISEQTVVIFFLYLLNAQNIINEILTAKILTNDRMREKGIDCPVKNYVP